MNKNNELDLLDEMLLAEFDAVERKVSQARYDANVFGSEYTSVAMQNDVFDVFDVAFGYFTGRGRPPEDSIRLACEYMKRHDL